jgi:hypothetical protein
VSLGANNRLYRLCENANSPFESAAFWSMRGCPIVHPPPAGRVGLGFLFSMDFVAQTSLFTLLAPSFEGSLEGPVLLCFSSPGLLIAGR